MHMHTLTCLLSQDVTVFVKLGLRPENRNLTWMFTTPFTPFPHFWDVFFPKKQNTFWNEGMGLPCRMTPRVKQSALTMIPWNCFLVSSCRDSRKLAQFTSSNCLQKLINWHIFLAPIQIRLQLNLTGISLVAFLCPPGGFVECSDLP